MGNISSQRTVIVNTGCANITSVRFALQRLGAQVTVSDCKQIIESADKVVLPGVGSAEAAMTSIQQKDLTSCLQALQQPVLGVCLGMQLMVDSSAEGRSGSIPCLSLIPGAVERMQADGLRLPHMGWNTVTPNQHDTIFKGIPDQTYFYFVHSFSVNVSPYTLATCQYGQTFSAALCKDNFYGVQFHPERSGDAGAQLLENFLIL